MTNFPAVFFLALVVNVTLTYLSTKKSNKQEDTVVNTKEWKSLVITKYLPVYLLATLSDWLQGPYVYALYADYGYSQHDIAVLFVAGFGSSMIFGSFIGGMADWGGRRNFVILFAITYAMSCMTKHFKNFYVLMLGRLLGGVSTSLLFSVFDAWLIRSHNDHKIKHLLGKSFSYAAYGNSIIAIVAGLVANKAANMSKMTTMTSYFYLGGYLTPFDLALCALIAVGMLARTTWEENYGEEDASTKKGHWYDGLQSALTTTLRSQEILLCGIISALFEGSMYCFVFMWTPALTETGDEELPFGLIFSTFMVSCMAGSALFSIQIEKVKGEKLGVAVFFVAAISMALVALAGSQTLKFIAMNLFEMTVGMYWPIMGTMKGAIVPESKRAAIYNLFRIPLNFIVLFSLLTDLSPTISFLLNGIMLGTACVLQTMLMKMREMHGMTENDASERASLVNDSPNKAESFNKEDLSV